MCILYVCHSSIWILYLCIVYFFSFMCVLIVHPVYLLWCDPEISISFIRKSFSLNCGETTIYLSHDLEATKPVTPKNVCAVAMPSLCILYLCSYLHPVCVSSVSILYMCPQCAFYMCVLNFRTLCVSSVCILYICPQCAFYMRVLDVHPLCVSSVCILYMCPQMSSCKCVLILRPVCVYSMCNLYVWPKCAFIMFVLNVYPVCVLNACPYKWIRIRASSLVLLFCNREMWNILY